MKRGAPPERVVMFLRARGGAKAVVNGDVTQVDLRARRRRAGRSRASAAICGSPCRISARDVICATRLVARIIDA
jgi:phosphate starvation-inducible protein PhoH